MNGDESNSVDLWKGDTNPRLEVWMTEDGIWIVELMTGTITAVELATSMMSRADAVQKAVVVLGDLQDKLSSMMFE